MTAAKLGIPLKLPPGLHADAESDVTAGTLTANLTVPPIKETINLFGLIPVTIEGRSSRRADHRHLRVVKLRCAQPVGDRRVQPDHEVDSDLVLQDQPGL